MAKAKEATGAGPPGHRTGPRRDDSPKSCPDLLYIQ